MKQKLLTIALSLGMAATGLAQQNERFSIATLNIDGLPQKILEIKVNGDGPGSAGTGRIGKYLVSKDYDMVFMQEDFNYHEDLAVWLEDKYQLDLWTGGVGLDAGKKIDLFHVQNLRFDCDGLMYALKKNINVSNSKMVPWTDGFGKFSHDNDLLATKGYRRYELTLASGTRMMVYNLHMDAELEDDTEEGKSGPDRAARLNQWKQLAEDVLQNINDCPIILLGDFNTLYIRDKAKEHFIDVINASGKGTVSDIWVELEKGGQYPAYQEDNRSRDDKEEEHGGEFLDKILYINPATASYKLKAVNFKYDREGLRHNGKPLSDHYPLSAVFEVEGIAAGISEVEAQGTGDHGVMYNLKGQRVNKPATGGLYIERNGNKISKKMMKL